MVLGPGEALKNNWDLYLAGALAGLLLIYSHILLAKSIGN